IIILGDFTGRTNRQVFESGPELTARSPVPVDRDNFDNLPARLGVGLCLPIASDGLRNRSEESEEPEKRRKLLPATYKLLHLLRVAAARRIRATALAYI